MRKKDKYILNGLILLAGGSIIFDVFKQWKEQREKGSNLTCRNYDGQQTFKLAFPNGVIGGLLGSAYYSYKINEESNLPFISDEYLRKVLSEELLKNDNAYLTKAVVYKEALKKKIIQPI